MTPFQESALAPALAPASDSQPHVHVYARNGAKRAAMEARLSDEWRGLLASFRRALLAENHSPETIRAYLAGVRHLGAFLAEHGMPTAVAVVAREHVEAFLADLLAQGRRPATARTWHGGCRAFFRWLLEEGEIRVSPMAHVRPPKVPEEALRFPTADLLTRLLHACGEGRALRDRRDAAMIRLLADTGLRRMELMGLRLDDLDMDANPPTIYVRAKGRRDRIVTFGRKAARDLDRYLRARAHHPDAISTPALWLGAQGPLTANGFYTALRSRARQAGIGHLHPHELRHFFAHAYLAKGGQESNLMRLAGWSSPAMLQRYGASLAAERARAEHQKLAPGDDL